MVAWERHQEREKSCKRERLALAKREGGASILFAREVRRPQGETHHGSSFQANHGIQSAATAQVESSAVQVSLIGNFRYCQVNRSSVEPVPSIVFQVGEVDLGHSKVTG